MHDMIHTIDEELINAKMINTPILIVEGIDDIKIYKNIATNAGKKCEVISAELINNYQEGCNSVIDLILELHNVIEQYPDLGKYVLGIIDRDVRYFRNEVPESDYLLILEKYSIENYFITTNVLKTCLLNITYLGDIPKDETYNFIKQILDDEIEILYYYSLDALKNACSQGYEKIIGYSCKFNNFFNNPIFRQRILDRKNELGLFAAEKKISIGDLDQIVKGKWILDYYALKLKRILKELPRYCRNSQIEQCSYCEKGLTDKCQYRSRISYNEGTIKELILTIFDYTEFDYITNRISSLA